MVSFIHEHAIYVPEVKAREYPDRVQDKPDSRLLPYTLPMIWNWLWPRNKSPAKALGELAAAPRVPAPTPASDDLQAATQGAVPDSATPEVSPLQPLPIERLIGSCSDATLVLTANEQQALARLRELLAMPRLPEGVLPRTPAVVPQLLRLLRLPDSSLADLAECVARDSFLVTEVMRLANSPLYRPLQAEHLSLKGAIAILGTRGLQAAASRVVLRPLLPDGHAPLLRAASEQVALDGLAQADLCVAELHGQSQAHFDAYLAGLLQGSGRMGVLVVLDRSRLWPDFPCSAEFSALAIDCADRLFGRLLQHWAFSPALTALGADLTAGLARHARASSDQTGWPRVPSQAQLLRVVLTAESRLLDANTAPSESSI